MTDQCARQERAEKTEFVAEMHAKSGIVTRTLGSPVNMARALASLGPEYVTGTCESSACESGRETRVRSGNVCRPIIETGTWERSAYGTETCASPRNRHWRVCGYQVRNGSI